VSEKERKREREREITKRGGGVRERGKREIHREGERKREGERESVCRETEQRERVGVLCPEDLDQICCSLL